jgi:hypothetical protein
VDVHQPPIDGGLDRVPSFGKLRAAYGEVGQNQVRINCCRCSGREPADGGWEQVQATQNNIAALFRRP